MNNLWFYILVKVGDILDRLLEKYKEFQGSSKKEEGLEDEKEENEEEAGWGSEEEGILRLIIYYPNA